MSVVVPVARPITLAVAEATTATSSILDPTDLFFSGETGTFLDFTSPQVYADTAGTDPAEVGEGIALTLDKSQGGELGPELVTNGDFSDGTTGWTGASSLGAPATLSINDGWMRVTANGTYSGWAAQIVSFPAGWVAVNVQWRTSGSAAAARVTTFFPPVDTELNGVSGLTTFYLPKTGGSGEVRVHCKIATGWVEYRIISVRELPGVHALQATSTARPIVARVPVGGRRNLLERTEEFDNAYWPKTNITASGGRVTANAGTFAAFVEKVIISATAGNYTLSLTFPPTAGRNRYVWLADRGIVGLPAATFDLDAVSVIGSSAPATPSITALEDGAVRCSVSYTRPATGTSTPQFALAGASHTADRPVLTFAGTEFLEAKAQLELGSTATPYQKVVTQYDITEAGVSSIAYANYDGVDDILPITLPAITGGTVALVGLNGIWIEDNWDYAGGTLNIGPTTIAGLPAGILDVVGGACTVIILNRAFTAAERAGVVAWGKARGAPGVFGLGPELVTNGDFSDGTTGWTLGAGWAISGGVAAFNAGTGAELQQSGYGFAANTTYQIEFDMVQVSGGGLRIVVDTSGSFVSQYFTSTARHKLVFSVSASSSRLRLAALGGANFTIDNISLRKLELIP